MRAGQDLRVLTASDNREFVLRALDWSDADDLLELENSLVDEDADVSVEAKKTRVQIVKWVAEQLVGVENDEKIAIVAEVDGRTVGYVLVESQGGRSSHVGCLTVMVGDTYRGVGIGTGLLEEAEKQSRRLGLKILEFEVYATNERAKRVYDKRGYTQVGYLPNAFSKHGSYVDSIIMAKVL